MADVHGAPLRIRVQWNGDLKHTDVLVTNPSGSWGLLTTIEPTEDGPGIIEGLRNLFPEVPVDVRPGAFRPSN